jgi:N-acetyl-anhydromuramyl-L-alanine amidase AmpD
MKKQNIDAIVIHCTATRAGQDVHASDIDKWHKERGFSCIGYNYVVRLDGTIEQGRPLTMDGAHCNTSGTSGKTYNKHSIGIVYVGGLDRDGNPADTRTVAQKAALVDLVYRLINEYPIVEVIGHRDASPDKNGNGKIERNEWRKQCPCCDVRAEFPMAICTAKRK